MPVDGLEAGRPDLLTRSTSASTPCSDELPGEERGVGRRADLAGLDGLEVADRRHGEGVLVVAEGVRPDDRAVDAAVAALPDPAEAVDEEVVADVAPAPRARVVGVDRRGGARAPGPGCSRWRSPCGGRSPRAPRSSAASPRRASTRRRPTGLARRSRLRRVRRRLQGGASPVALAVVLGRHRRSSRTRASGPVPAGQGAGVDRRPLGRRSGRRRPGRSPRASCRRAAVPSCARATWTSSTSPTSSGSVPGRACRPSALSGSGPCSGS